MTVSADSSRGEVTCPKCGAIGRRNVEKCWLCGFDANEISEVNPYQAPVSAEPAQEVRKLGGMTGLVLGVAYVFVSIAVLAMLPGPGMILLVFGAPAVARAWKIRKKREEKGMQVTGLQQSFLLLSSFLTISVSVFLVFIAAFGTFCGVCLTGVTSQVASEQVTILVAFLAAAIVGIATVAACRKFMQRQWLRDTLDDQ